MGDVKFELRNFFYDMTKFFFPVNEYLDKLRNFILVHKAKKGIFQNKWIK